MRTFDPVDEGEFRAAVEHVARIAERPFSPYTPEQMAVLRRPMPKAPEKVGMLDRLETTEGGE